MTGGQGYRDLSTTSSIQEQLGAVGEPGKPRDMLCREGTAGRLAAPAQPRAKGQQAMTRHIPQDTGWSSGQLLTVLGWVLRRQRGSSGCKPSPMH